MQPENWKAIEKAVGLDDADRAALDKFQASLALNDADFLQLLVAIRKVANANWLGVRLTKL
jgi:hypothetical protein